MSKYTLSEIKEKIRIVADFPKKGINFIDITTALKNPAMFAFLVDEISSQYINKGYTKVACIESRGFILGGAIAKSIGAGFIPIRKPNKLPAETYKVEYELEYGTDIIEVHKDAFSAEDKVLIHDDLLATGGTALATIQLLAQFGINKCDFSFMCELSFLEARKRLELYGNVNSLLIY